MTNAELAALVAADTTGATDGEYALPSLVRRYRYTGLRARLRALARVNRRRYQEEALRTLTPWETAYTTDRRTRYPMRMLRHPLALHPDVVREMG